MRASGLISILILSLSCFAYSKDLVKPVKDSKFEFILLKDDLNTDVKENARLSSLTGLTIDQATFGNLGCAPAGPGLAAATLIPIFAAVGTQIFEHYQDSKLEKLKKLKRDSQNEYSESLIVTTEQLKQAKCALLIRYSEKTDANKSVTVTPGLIALLRIEHQTNTAKQMMGYRIWPVYVQAHNATVVTLANKKVQPKINLGFALTAKAVLPDANKSSSGLSVASTSTGITDVELGKEPCDIKKMRESTEVGSGRCKRSDLMPHYDTDTVISLTMSVAEIGQTGIDFDAREAEIKAIREAYGPAIGDAITAGLEED